MLNLRHGPPPIRPTIHRPCKFVTLRAEFSLVQSDCSCAMAVLIN